MKLMSFNTQHCKNFITQTIDYAVMAQAIQNCGADIVGLNEMRDTGSVGSYDKQVSMLSELTGLSHHYFAKAIEIGGDMPYAYGNGFLSNIPIVSAEVIPVPDPPVRREGGRHYETRCLLKAKLENGLTVLVIHFGLNPEEAANAAQTVCEHLVDEKCILMGDFNVTPDNPVLAPIRARMKDTADFFTAPRFSYPSDAPNRKIDYIFVSPDIEVISADIPAVVASDHRPHTAEIKL